MIRAASRSGSDSGSDSSHGRPSATTRTHRAWRFPLLAGVEPWQDDDARDPASPTDDDNDVDDDEDIEDGNE